MKEILRKIRNPFKIVLGSLSRFSSFCSKTTIVALATILCLSNAMGQEVTLLSNWTSGATKAKEIGTNRLLVVMAMGEASAPFSVTSITYGGQEMKKQIEKRQGDTGTGTYASIFTLDEAGINAATSDQIVDTWAGLTNMSNRNVYSAFLINVDQNKPIGDTASFKISSGTTLSAATVYAATGDMVLQSSGFAANTNPTMINGFSLLFESNSSWGDGIGCVQMGADANITPGITQSAAGRMALCAIVVKKAKSMVKTPVVLLDSWTTGTTKPKAVGTKRLLVVAVTGETAVMNDITDLSLTYGGQVMTKQVSDQNGTTAFGDLSYIFTLNEAGIVAADASGTIVPTWTTKAPSGGVDFFSAFFDKVDQTSPVSATSKINLNGTTATAPAVDAAFGDMVLMSVAFAGQPRTPTYPTGFTQILKNPNNQSWGSGIIAYKDGDGSSVIPSITNSASERVALTAIVLKQGEEEGIPPVYYTLTANATNGTITLNPQRIKFIAGTVVKVKATPNFGFYFVNWTDSLKGVVTDTALIVMNSNKTITANFAEKTKYTVTTEVSNGNIYLNPAGGTYYEGVEVTALAKPNVGFEFKGWGGDISGTDNPLKIVVNSNKFVKAIIEKIPAYTITITAVNGSVKTMPAKATYDPGEAVILIATPAEGYKFKVWEGDLTSTQNPTSMIMNADKVLKAVFEVAVGVDDLNNGSEQGMLAQNYPNPFSAVTTIPYQLKKDSHVRLTVYNSLGERITTLVNKDQVAGQYKVDWNAKSDNGKSLANGIYFYRLEIDNNLVQAKKAVVTK